MELRSENATVTLLKPIANISAADLHVSNNDALHLFDYSVGQCDGVTLTFDPAESGSVDYITHARGNIASNF